MADYRSLNRDGLQNYVHKLKEPKPNRDNNNSATFIQNVEDTFNELQELLIKKHLDYGPKNIANSPGGALNGLRVRMHDKLARINHLIDSGVKPENESLHDSFLDLANYAIIAQLVIRGEWPND